MPPNVALAAQLLSFFLDCTYHVLKCRFKDAGADGGLQVAVGGGDGGGDGGGGWGGCSGALGVLGAYCWKMSFSSE